MRGAEAIVWPKLKRIRRYAVSGQLAAIRALRKREPKELVRVVPVAPLETLQRLHTEVDAIVCPDTPQGFGVSYYYCDFRQVSDDEVIAILKRFPARKMAAPPESRGFPWTGHQARSLPICTN